MKSCLALALLLAIYIGSAIAGGVVVAYKSNVTLVDQDSYKYRATAIWGWDVIYASGASFAAVQADVTKNSAELDVVFGAAWVGTGIAPSAYVCYFGAQAQFQNNSAGSNVSVSAAAALIASAWVTIDELDTNGNVVKTLNLKDLIWITDSSNLPGFGGLRYITFVGAPLFPPSNLKIYITYVQSDVVGVLNVVGDPIITPRSVETILDIENFPYTSSSNRLRLNFAVGAAAGAVSADATSYTIGSGNSAAYFQLKGVAAFNGKVGNVEVSEWIAAEGGAASLQSGDLGKQVSAKWGSAAVFKIVSVTTTQAGASSIIYDPSIGNGPVPTASSANSIVFSSLLLALLLIVVSLM